jgi:hypothetical protein
MHELLERHNDVHMFGIPLGILVLTFPRDAQNSPIRFRPVIRIDQILNRQLMEIFMVSKCLNNVPAQSIYINPPAFYPIFLRFF